MFLSMGASSSQGDLIFSGVFSIVWIGEAVVTLQIKMLGGNMFVSNHSCSRLFTDSIIQFIYAIRQHHRIYPISTCHRCSSQRRWPSFHCPDTGVHCARWLVASSGSQHTGGIRRDQKPGWSCSIPIAGFLYQSRLSLFY